MRTEIGLLMGEAWVKVQTGVWVGGCVALSVFELAFTDMHGQEGIVN